MAVEEERHQQIREAPVWWKYVTLPAAVVAAPFVYIADKLRPEGEPGPEVPNLEQFQSFMASDEAKKAMEEDRLKAETMRILTEFTP